MARPIKRRRICQLPKTVEFSPPSKPVSEAVILGIDEYEAIRLIDYLGLTQEECAMQMNVARTTVQAIYDSARKKLAAVLVNGMRLIIDGGCYDICINASKCCGKDCKVQGCREARCGGAATNCTHCDKCL